MKRILRLAVALMLVVSAVPWPVQAHPSTTTTSSVPSAGHDVTIAESGFDPVTVHGTVNDQVNWTNTTTETVRVKSGAAGRNPPVPPPTFEVFLPLVLSGFSAAAAQIQWAQASLRAWPAPSAAKDNGVPRTWFSALTSQGTLLPSDGAEPAWSSPDLLPGQNWKMDFTQSGRFPYYDPLHPARMGVVAVLDQTLSGTVTQAEGGALATSHVLVTFPPGAVTETLRITYTPQLLPPTPPEAILAAWAFTLEGANHAGQPRTQFLQPYTITYTYADTEVADLEEGTLDLFWRATPAEAWTSLKGAVVTSTNHLVVTSTHFSDFTVLGRVPPPPGATDSDGDWLYDDEEATLGTNRDEPDSDFDGLSDYREVRELGTNPLLPDSDADFLPDRDEIEVHGTDPNDADTDDDTLLDSEEVNTTYTDPHSPDSDADGIGDAAEAAYGTDPNDADSDDDGLTDGEEVNDGADGQRTDPSDPDCDDDDLLDGQEAALGTHPLHADSDKDGISDIEEVTTGSDGYLTDPLVQDSDGDGLRDGEELLRGCHPLNPDSDNDGLTDGEEVTTYSTHPLDPDTDGDGLRDIEEVTAGSDGVVTSPLKADTDGDGMPDKWEVDHGLPPHKPDAGKDLDRDGLLNEAEYLRHTDPQQSDTDQDGLADGEEIAAGTDPLSADTDGDAIADSVEILAGTNPLNPNSDDDGIKDGVESGWGGDTDADGTINALDTDSDDDGLADEAEDINRDGVIDGDLNFNRVLDAGETWHETDPTMADTDRDGLPDGWEITQGLDPLDSTDAGEDPDADHLTTSEEFLRGTEWTVSDSDGDSIPDGDEVAYGMDPLDPTDAVLDADGDLVPNSVEHTLGETRGNHDSDGDGLPLVLDPDSDNDGLDDGTEDMDRDGLIDGDANSDRVRQAGETWTETDPLVADTDSDGVPDGTEPSWADDTDGDGAMNALDSDSDNDGRADGVEDADRNGAISGDSNGNRWLDAGEMWSESDPLTADSDRDGLHDGAEVGGANGYVTSPNKADTDGDGLDDFAEPNLYGTDPTRRDTDYDGIEDGREVWLQTDPLAADSDWDGIGDGAELAQETAPLNPDSDGDGVWDDVDPWPLDRDRDQDGLWDGQELVPDANGLRFEIEDFSPDKMEDHVVAMELVNPTIHDAQESLTAGIAPGSDRLATIAMELSPPPVRLSQRWTYDRETLGSASAEWQGDPMVVTDTTSASPGHSLALMDNSSSTQAAAAYIFPHTTRKIRFDFRLNAGDMTGSFRIGVEEGASDADGMRLIVTDDGNAYYGTDSGPVAFASGLSGWHRFRLEIVDVQVGDYAVWMDGRKVVDKVSLVGSPASLSRIVIADNEDGGGSTGPVYLDDVALQAESRPQSGSARIYVRARALEAGANGGLLQLVLEDGGGALVDDRAFPVMVDLYRWYVTSDLTVTKGDYTLNLVDRTGGMIAVDKALIAWDGPLAQVRATQADATDSDGDGLADGQEASPTDTWIEAELYSGTGIAIREFVDDAAGDDSGLEASNGFATTHRDPTRDIAVVPAGPLYAAGTYQLYVRARVDSATMRRPEMIAVVETDDVHATEVLALTDRYEWHTTAALSFVLTHPGPITVTLRDTDNPSGAILVDKLLISRRRFVPFYVGKVWVEQPLNLYDPLDPDTDGDAFRPDDYKLPGSFGYLTDGWEFLIHTNPFDIDSDDDAVDPAKPEILDPALTDDADENPLSDDNDADGLKAWADPDDADDDVDDDGVLDGNEDTNLNGVWDAGEETDLQNPDTDGDKILDGTEIGLPAPQGEDTKAEIFIADADPTSRTDPLATDSDGDGLPDQLEDANQNGRHDAATEPTDAAAADTDRDLLDDGSEDADADGLIAGDLDGDRTMDPGEIWTETDPARADTDGDGLGDGQETLTFGTGPLDSDSDDDGLLDGLEVTTYATDPNDADSDDDGLTDRQEILTHGTQPLNTDSDGDGLSDGSEVTTTVTNPLDADSDDDELDDWEEVNAGVDGYVTDPQDPDGDGDGITDGLEATYGWNPTDTDQPSAPAPGQTFELAQVAMASTSAWINSTATPGVLVTHGEIHLGDANDFNLDLVGTLTVTLSTGEMEGAGALRTSIRGHAVSFEASGPIGFDEAAGIITCPVDERVILFSDPEVSVGISGTLTVDLDNGSLSADGELDQGLIRTEGNFTIWPAQGIVSLGTQAAPITYTLTLPEPIGVEVTFGTAYASLNLSDTLALAGRAALTLPDLPGGATLELPNAAFLVDFDTWHFMFDVSSDFTLELGSVSVGVGGPGGGRFELAIESGYLALEGSFDLPPLELEGTLELDLFSTIEPNVWYTPTHTTSEIAGFKGHYRVEGSVPIPLPPPPLPPGPAAINITGESVMRLPFLDPDLDPLEPPSYGSNGTAELEMGVGVASLGFELGGASAAIDFVNKKIYFASESGIALGDVVEDLPAGLGNIGLGLKAQMEFIFDWEPDPGEYLAYTAPITSVYTMPTSDSAPILVGSGRYNYYGFQADISFLVDFDLSEEFSGDHIGGLYMSGSLDLPIDVGTPISVVGDISWDGNLLLTGMSNLEIAGYQLAGTTVTLTNDALTLSGMLDLPGVGTATIDGNITADGRYAFTGTAALTPGGFDLAGATVLFTNDGLWVDGSLTLPNGIATAVISGTVTPDAYHFEGRADLGLGGFTMAAAQLVVDSSTGLVASGAVTIPNAGSISLFGAIHPSGAFTLTGYGTLAPYDVQILNASFTLTKPSGGVVTFTGTGAVLAGGKTLASASLTLRSDGYIHGQGTLNWSAVSATATFTIDPAGGGGVGSFALSAALSVSATISGYGVTGSVSFGASGTVNDIDLYATFSGSVTAAGYSLAGVSAGISSNGNIQVNGFPYPCPALTNPLKICHSQITIDIL